MCPVTCFSHPVWQTRWFASSVTHYANEETDGSVWADRDNNPSNLAPPTHASSVAMAREISASVSVPCLCVRVYDVSVCVCASVQVLRVYASEQSRSIPQSRSLALFPSLHRPLAPSPPRTEFPHHPKQKSNFRLVWKRSASGTCGVGFARKSICVRLWHRDGPNRPDWWIRSSVALQVY